MAIEFLQVTPEEAVEMIQECARKGYAIRHVMQSEHDGVSGSAGVTDEMVADWSNKILTWVEETRLTLLKIYSSPNYMYRFLEIKADAVHSANEERRFNNMKKGLLYRIDTLNGYVDFIIQNSHPSFSTQNNLTYLHLNPKRDLNIAGNDIKTKNK